MKLTRREFLALSTATAAEILGAGCLQPKESGATQVKKPESKPQYSSNIDERIIEEINRKGEEINDVVFKLKKISTIESGLVDEWTPKHEILLRTPDVYGAFFRTPEPFFNLNFSRLQGKLSSDEIVMGYLNALSDWVIPPFVINFIYDHPEVLDEFTSEEEEKNKIIEEVKWYVKNWDDIVLRNMKEEMEFRKDRPWRIFYWIDPRVAKKYEDELQDVFEKYPKTTEIYFEELLPLIKKYGVRWREDYERRENEIEKGIKESLKYTRVYAEKMCEDKFIKEYAKSVDPWYGAIVRIREGEINISGI